MASFPVLWQNGWLLMTRAAWESPSVNGRLEVIEQVMQAKTFLMIIILQFAFFCKVHSRWSYIVILFFCKLWWTVLLQRGRPCSKTFSQITQKSQNWQSNTTMGRSYAISLDWFLTYGLFRGPSGPAILAKDPMMMMIVMMQVMVMMKIISER